MKLDDTLKELTSRIKASPLATRFVKGAIWSVAGAGISRGLTLVASVISARILGQAAFGQLGMIQSTVGTFGAFAGLGLGMTATKYLASLRVTDPGKAGRILALLSLVSYITATVVSLGLILYAPMLATQTLKEQQLTVPLQIGAILMLLGVVNGVQTGALAGFEVFRAISRVNLVAGISSFPLVIAGAYLYGLRGTVWGLVGSMTINCWLNNRVLRKVSREQNVLYRFRNCLQEKDILISFTLPSALSGYIVVPVMWYANVLLINQPNGYLAMGVFNAAQQWQSAILFLPASLSPLVLSLLANTHSLQHSHDYWRLVKLSFSINAGIAGFAAILVSICSVFIMRAYGASFAAGWLVLCLLSLTAFLNASVNVIGQIIASSASMWWGFFLNLLWAIAFICFSYLFIAQYRALGLAFAYLAAYACHLGWTGIYAYIKTKPRIN